MSNFLFPLNPPSWSLFFELIVNVLYAVRSWPRYWVWAILVVCYVLIVITTYAFEGPAGWGTSNIVGGVPRAIFSFFVGTLLFEAWSKRFRNCFHLGPLAPSILVLAMCSIPYSHAAFVAMILIACPLTV
jgi:peptidoglycan/LPS O-acetylase OafA/YrhL